MRLILAALAAGLLITPAFADPILDRLEKVKAEAAETRRAAARAEYAADKAIEARKAEVTAPPAPEPPAPVDAPQPPTGSPVGQWTEDATRDYYNHALRLAWSKTGGDWIDATGTLHGDRPFASYAYSGSKDPRVIDLDVTELVRQHGGNIWLTGWAVTYHAREGGKGAVLIVDGTEKPVLSDAGLNISTMKGTGDSATIGLGAALLRFDQAAGAVKSAILRLTVEKSTSGSTEIKVFVAAPQVIYPTLNVPADGTEADIVLRVSGEGWRNAAGWSSYREDRQTIHADGSMTAVIPKGEATGAGAMYEIPAAKRATTMFARFVMTIHPDWNGVAIGGKLPGLANTGQHLGAAGKPFAGYGANVANGTRWSARTNRNPVVQPGWMGFGPYAYRVNRVSLNGDSKDSVEALPIGKRFVLDQMVKLNTPGKQDGLVAYWLDGRLVNVMTGIEWRSHDGPDTLSSELWLDVYIGGTGYSAPHPHTITFHEAIVSTKRLGGL